MFAFSHTSRLDSESAEKDAQHVQYQLQPIERFQNPVAVLLRCLS
jgi:hypothetical protein